MGKESTLHMTACLYGGKGRKWQSPAGDWPLPHSPFSPSKTTTTRKTTSPKWPSSPKSTLPSSAGALELAQLTAQLASQAKELEQLRAQVNMPAEEPAPVDSFIEKPLTDSERAELQARLSSITAAVQALRLVSGAEAMCTTLDNQASELRNRLHQSKPLAARKQALEDALSRRDAARNEQVAVRDAARDAMAAADAAITKLDKEIDGITIELAALSTQIEAALPSSPEEVLREFLLATQTGTPPSSTLISVAAKIVDSSTMDVAQPLSLATPRVDLVGDSPGSIRSKDPLWSAMRGGIAQARLRPY